MRGNVFVRAKKGYGEGIEKKTLGLLKKLGMKITNDAEKADIAILIGGDGTFLRHQNDLKCPILGINPGQSIGFYLKADNKNFEDRIKKVIEGKIGKDYFVFEMSRLETFINDEMLDVFALNEVLICPIYTRKIMKAELQIGKNMSIEHNSGIIIYTPTGSNAFAHSAGAKKLDFTEKKFGIVAVAPYKGFLTKGAFLMDGEVSVIPLTEPTEICIDGQEKQIFQVKNGDTISIRKSKNPAKIIGFG